MSVGGLKVLEWRPRTGKGRPQRGGQKHQELEVAGNNRPGSWNLEPLTKVLCPAMMSIGGIDDDDDWGNLLLWISCYPFRCSKEKPCLTARKADVSMSLITFYNYDYFCIAA
ncbi:jg13068 [Pararge aegeria aegeria]|uniref:Jg13068 protein n=1 Tax=Pararge aegeria aegeria TaxID=348720 RepID=A0A8S4QR24_9NEOP|nr:jg13068 [Pararge aegeria aegeria]